MASVQAAVDVVGLDPTADKSSMTTNKFLNPSKAEVQVLHLLLSFFLYSAILRDILGFIPDTHTRHANQHKMFVSTVSFFKEDCQIRVHKNEGRSLHHYKTSLP